MPTSSVDGSGVHAIYVRPAADYWERYIRNPSLESGQINIILNLKEELKRLVPVQ